MWLREPVPIEVSRTAKVPIGLQFWDEDEDYELDITGYSFSGVVALADGNPAIYSFPIMIVSASEGAVDFTIDGAALNAVAGVKEAVTLAYQVKANDEDGNSIIALRGPLILTPGI